MESPHELRSRIGSINRSSRQECRRSVFPSAGEIAVLGKRFGGKETGGFPELSRGSERGGAPRKHALKRIDCILKGCQRRL
jgi:hypothetical protein